MDLLELLGVLSPGGSVIGGAATFVVSSRHGRDLADDTLRGAGIGGLVGAGFAFIFWAGDQLTQA